MSMRARRIQPAVQRMLDVPGYYVCGDSLAPKFEAPLVSKDGKVFCVLVKDRYEFDRELDPLGFSETITIRGPMSYEEWTAP